MPQSGFIRRGAGFGAEKNEDGAAECRQKILLIGGPIINKRANLPPPPDWNKINVLGEPRCNSKIKVSAHFFKILVFL